MLLCLDSSLNLQAWHLASFKAVTACVSFRTLHLRFLSGTGGRLLWKGDLASEWKFPWITPLPLVKTACISKVVKVHMLRWSWKGCVAPERVAKHVLLCCGRPGTLHLSRSICLPSLSLYALSLPELCLVRAPRRERCRSRESFPRHTHLKLRNKNTCMTDVWR